MSTKILVIDRTNQRNIVIPYISEEEVYEFYEICNHWAGSTRFHNTERDGLFLHSMAVANQVTLTAGFRELTSDIQNLLVHLALYHDFESKVVKWGKLSEPVYNSYRDKWVYPILAKYLEDRKDSIFCGEIIDAKDTYTFEYLYQYWQFKHHGQVDIIPIYYFSTDYLPTHVNVFYHLVAEVSRCDAYNAAYSSALKGLCQLAIHLL